MKPLLPTRVAAIVPTKNSARTLSACLESLRAQSARCRLVVVDNGSTDGTLTIARALADVVISAGPERSSQRNAGARAAPETALLFIDSDMILEPTVVEEVLRLIDLGAFGVIIPERTVGRGVVARVRAFERSLYVGSDSIEAARAFPRGVFFEVGGFDEMLTGGEDWDLTIRVRRAGPIRRTTAGIAHDEFGLTYLDACRKKAYYAPGLRAFSKKHGRTGIDLAIDRPWLKRPWTLLYPHPLLGLGLIVLKVGEAIAVAQALVRAKPRRD